MTKIKQVTFIIILTLIGGCSEQKQIAEKTSIKWVNFDWANTQTKNQVYEKSAINIPVKIGNISDNFTMQFDLGANRTMLYGQTFEPYFNFYPRLKNNLDTINGTPYVTNTLLSLDNKYEVSDFSFFYNANFGEQLDEDLIGKESVKHIGTIGVNLFKEKILIIDYPSQQIALLDSIPLQYKKLDTYIDISLDRRGRIHLPININGIVKNVLFDTGSSMFPLMTSSDNWQKYTDGIKQDSVLTSTWGNYYYTYAANSKNVSIGNRALSDKRVFDAPYLNDFFEQENIWGIMGNAHFFEDLVVIDFKNLKFGWIKNSNKRNVERE